MKKNKNLGLLDKFKKRKQGDTGIIETKETFSKENVFEVRNFSLWYRNGEKQALFDIKANIKLNKITSLIGPSGCGKSTFLRSLNRMNDLIEGVIQEGDIFFDGTNIKSKKIPITTLRTRVGMVFQKPTPFPISIYDNVAYGPKSNGIHDKKVLDKIVKESLEGAALWKDVENNLNDLGTGLSGGQQQRLCIARAIAMEPEVLLMDEPTSSLDPISTVKIEELILQLKEKYTIIIVTHSMAQAQRISDETFFFYQGKIIETGETKKIFLNPENKETKDYINGRIG
ncbi:MAG: phosphate ABC transporter ATP-binding protein PstB [Metamycoplasmataceae bacterium]